jgi:lysyl-tRNA synthetase class 2
MKGELSIFPSKFVVLSPCLHMLPRQKVYRKVGDRIDANASFRFIISWIRSKPIVGNVSMLMQGPQQEVKSVQRWTPGQLRNPDAYTLKDQVNIIEIH